MAVPTAQQQPGEWKLCLFVALGVKLARPGALCPSLPLARLLVTVSLLQCLQGNSDIKTHKAFITVMGILCECKDQASKTFTR